MDLAAGVLWVRLEPRSFEMRRCELVETSGEAVDAGGRSVAVCH